MNKPDYDTAVNALKRIEPSEQSKAAHAKLYPHASRFSYGETVIPSNAIKCAVLILFYKKNDGQLYFCLIKRAEYDGLHSGQMALPGGKFERSDKDLSITAIRETHEEIGILPANISIINHLAQVYIPISNSLITPYLGLYNTHIAFTPNKKEVQKIVEVELQDFLMQQAQMTSIESMNLQVPAYIINDNVVWGATSMILSDLQMSLLQMLNER